MFQMRFYALVLWRLRGVVPRLLQLLYLGNGEVLRYAPDEADLLATERKVARALGGDRSGPPRPATGGRARAGSATGATTRRSARPSAARRRRCPCCRCPLVPQARAADERPSPHTPGDEV